MGRICGTTGTEVELSLHGPLAFELQSADRTRGCFAGLYLRRARTETIDRNPGRYMNDQARIRVLCVDDHPLLREGIVAIINSQPDMVITAEAATGLEAVQKYRELQPDVTFMD